MFTFCRENLHYALWAKANSKFALWADFIPLCFAVFYGSPYLSIYLLFSTEPEPEICMCVQMFCSVYWRLNHTVQMVLFHPFDRWSKKWPWLKFTWLYQIITIVFLFFTNTSILSNLPRPSWSAAFLLTWQNFSVLHQKCAIRCQSNRESIKHAQRDFFSAAASLRNVASL